MAGVKVTSEIKPLKKVLLHRPGRELYLTPDTLLELLFDDIPYLRIAQEEHDAFAATIEKSGAEVVYLEDLMAEVLGQSPDVRRAFLEQYIAEAGIETDDYRKAVYDYLDGNYPSNKDLVLKTMEGVNRSELRADKSVSLADMVNNASKMAIPQIPNLYFTRDPFATIGAGVSLNKMYSLTRCRETIYGEYIFRYHPAFNAVPRYYSRYNPFHIEGGDILNLNEEVVIVGVSQRTEPEAIDRLARNLFGASESRVRTILAFNIPYARAFMHLDTVFTQIDHDKFTVFPGILGSLVIFEITPDRKDGTGGLTIRESGEPLRKILSRYAGHDVELILCAGGDRSAAEREQWNDGANALCVSPGTVIVYDRNDITNAILRERGVNVLEIPSCELARGRGGPRCMSMPLLRED